MLLDKIKADHLQARKANDALRKKTLESVIGDLDTISKRTGTATTDADVIAMVKKHLDGAVECMNLISDPDSGAFEDYKAAVEILKSYMPTVMTAAELEEAIRVIVEGVVADTSIPQKSRMGNVMRILKERHAGTYDGKLAQGAVALALAAYP